MPVQTRGQKQKEEEETKNRIAEINKREYTRSSEVDGMFSMYVDQNKSLHYLQQCCEQRNGTTLFEADPTGQDPRYKDERFEFDRLKYFFKIHEGGMTLEALQANVNQDNARLIQDYGFHGLPAFDDAEIKQHFYGILLNAWENATDKVYQLHLRKLMETVQD